MRRLVLLPTLLVCLVVATACHTTDDRAQDGFSTNPRPVYCTVMPDAPRRDADPPRTVIGVVRFRCDSPGADALTLAIRLERRNGSQWTPVARRTVVARGEQTLAATFKYQRTNVSTACAAGRFRTVVEWSRSSRGVTTPDESRSVSTMDPCATRIF